MRSVSNVESSFRLYWTQIYFLIHQFWRLLRLIYNSEDRHATSVLYFFTFNSQVDLHVFFKILLLAILRRATHHSAGIRQFTRVDEHVSLQVEVKTELLETNTALVIFNTRVRQHVPLKFWTVCAQCLALLNLTLISLLLSVNEPYVLF